VASVLFQSVIDMFLVEDLLLSSRQDLTEGTNRTPSWPLAILALNVATFLSKRDGSHHRNLSDP